MKNRQKDIYDTIKRLTKNNKGPKQIEVANKLGLTRSQVGQVVRRLIEMDEVEITQNKELIIKKYYVCPKRLKIKIKK